MRTILISIIIAGVFAGLILASQRLSSSSDPSSMVQSRAIGFDPAAVVEIRAKSGLFGTDRAYRESRNIDGWKLVLNDENEWKANPTRVRTVLRALASASLGVADATELKDTLGTLTLIDRESVAIEISFDRQAAGGFVLAEVVRRGVDGIATNRWFGRVEQSFRDSILTEGLKAWRSDELFDQSMNDVSVVEISAVNRRVSLSRGQSGWMVTEPWTVRADSDRIHAMLGLTLGLRADRFYNQGDYSEELTGLVNPAAMIRFTDLNGGHTQIEIGSAIDGSGEEVFARYTTAHGNSAIVAINSDTLNRLTASPLAYVTITAEALLNADIQSIRILDSTNKLRLECTRNLDSWSSDGIVLSPSMINAVDRLIHVMNNEQAVLINELAVIETDSIGLIELKDRSDQTHRLSVSIGSAPDGNGGIVLSVRKQVSDEVLIEWVLGSTEAAATGAWIAAMISGD